jgi:sialate O-acetylesterase
MINPLIPTAIAGVIWYHENNGEFGYEYRTALPTMIKDWRTRWDRGDFPFYYVQIPNFNSLAKTPNAGLGWAEVREAQFKTLSVPNTGMAVLIDVGDEGNVHPANKKDPGNRLALIDLARTYGKAIACSSPMYDTMAVEGDKIRIRFTHAEDGLTAKPVPDFYKSVSTDTATKPLIRNSPGSELEGFSICGEDRKWVWAQAKTEGKCDVVVWSAEIPKPVAVRYGWADNPICNLYNSAGLPAATFRTDDFPEFSQKRKKRFGLP